MKDQKRTTNTQRIKHVKYTKVPILIKGNESIDLNRFAVVSKNDKNKSKVSVVALNVADTYKIIQPEEIIEKYSSKEGDNVITHIELSSNYKHLFIECGVAMKKGNRVKHAFKSIEVEGIRIDLFRLDVFRYDQEKNDKFMVVQLNTDKKHSLFVPIKQNEEIFEFGRLLDSVKDSTVMGGTIRKFCYRNYTKHNSNDYKGFEKISEVPDTHTATLDRLVRLVDHFNMYSNKYGPSCASMFAAFVAYHNDKRKKSDIERETLNPEYKIELNKVWKGIIEILKKM